MKALEPMKQKLGTQTWFYSKRCLLALCEALAKHLIVLSDESVSDILEFLDACEGKRERGRGVNSCRGSLCLWTLLPQCMEERLRLLKRCRSRTRRSMPARPLSPTSPATLRSFCWR